MLVSSISVLSYSEGFENYVLSVLHSGNSSMSESFVSSLSTFDFEGKIYSSENSSSSLLNFTIVNKVEESFVQPGAKDVEIMGLMIKSGDEPVVVKQLRLQIVGIDPEYIENAYIMDGKKKIRVGVKDSEYFSFSRIDKLIKADHTKILRLYVDLSDELHSGQRFRMDIEEPKDIVIYSGKDLFNIDEFYPIQGKYLSVVQY